MDSIATPDVIYDFIQLDRTFHELSSHSDKTDDVELSRAFSIGESLRWTDLISEYRVIILSEAGSGKTAEIRNVARMLREQGKPAFFLRLENIARDFEDAFEVGSIESFEEWLESGEQGWLLLDSIDEARLRDPRDFELAIRKLSRRINTAKDRTHIVITGRTTSWRPKTDLAYCTDHLPFAVAATSESDSQDEEDVPKGILQTKTDARDNTKTPFKIVALDDLTSDQITAFVNARKIENTIAFLDAVERADAWSFTSRPQDLEELSEYWIDEGRIGTRLEIMRNSIDRRLAERDQGRADAHPLSAERARQGARLLAAATTLVQEPTIRVPDGAENSNGIAVQSVLPDWDDKDQSTLLSRPIFDDAIYSTVRFHHRSVREFLTAEWFAELLKRETSRRNIEGLFFRNQYGLDIIVPTLRPILPWLVILDEKIRERVRKVAPSIIFEGGDPSQLPLDVRRDILNEVCEQIADGTIGHSVQNYAAAQRFANQDLTDEVRTLLQKYSDNKDLVAFLLRMVWLGQLVDALPETMSVALSPAANKYSRIEAFSAIKAIGSSEDQENVRRSFQGEGSKLNREWLAELLSGLQPSEESSTWILACLEKIEPKERYKFDHLADKVTEFVDTADIGLLPLLAVGLNRLLSIPPVIERRYCNVSEHFQWLILPASKAVERLILSRHSSSLKPYALAILHNFSAASNYGSDDLADSKVEFSTLVPAWKELNQALFWFEVQQSRKAVDKKSGERLTDFWRASIFGSFWKFDEGDFEYVAGEISQQAFLDNRLVALSLAFNLYKGANRPRTWLTKLKKSVADNDELSECLRTCLNPNAQSQDSRRHKQQEAKWKRRNDAEKRKQEKYHTKWKKFLNEELDQFRASFRDKPGILINPLRYLFDQTRNEKNTSMRWTEYNWKTLIPEYGEHIAHFYRDSTVSFWRHHDPILRSEGAAFNQTTFAVLFGLTGIEIESIETNDWSKNLSATEVQLACKYATFELNGFPTWFPKLFETHPKIVSDFIMKEVRYELSIEQSRIDTHYIINGISCSCQWAWDQIAPSIYNLLKKEPKNLSNLDHLLKIMQRSTLANESVEKLAFRKCRTLKKLDHLARWFAVWAGVTPAIAIPAFKTRIVEVVEPKERTLFAMTFITNLIGGRMGEGATSRQAFKTPDFLKSLYLLMHQHIRREDDIERAGKGTYSPELRDHAQDARSSLLNLLNEIPGKESFLNLMEIALEHPEEDYRPWIKLKAKSKAEQDGDLEAWSPSQVKDFHERLERTPSNHRELADLAVLRLLDLKDDLEHGDSSVAEILKAVEYETDMRKFIGRELREKAHGRYSIPQEEELADAKRPDMRFQGVNFDGPVPVELKLADKDWGGPKLFERLENQLCGDYLRDNRSSRGIFLLIYRGKQTTWRLPESENHVDFSGLIIGLQDHWQLISQKFPNVDDITVIGIDLTKRSI